MAYQSYYPNAYQQPYFGTQGMFNNPVMQTSSPVPASQPTQTVSSGLIWVQGEAGAKSYMVAANTTVLLMDSEKSKFYIKSTDASGMPLPLRTFVYSEETGAEYIKRTEKPTENTTEEYVTRAEFDALKSEFEALATKKSAKPAQKGEIINA